MKPALWDEEVLGWEAEDRLAAERTRACGALAAMILLGALAGVGVATLVVWRAVKRG